MVSAKKDQQEIQGQLERSQMGGVEHTGQREVESLLLFSFIHRGLSRDEERKRDRSMRLGRPAKMIDKSRFTPTIPAHSLGWFAAVCRKDSVLPAHNRSALKIPIVVVTTRRRHDIFTSDTQLPRFGRVRRQQRYGGCGLFKRFHGVRPLFHLLHESRIGVIVENSAKLCPVVAHDTGVVNDHVVHKPFA